MPVARPGRSSSLIKTAAGESFRVYRRDRLPSERAADRRQERGKNGETTVFSLVLSGRRDVGFNWCFLDAKRATRPLEIVKLINSPGSGEGTATRILRATRECKGSERSNKRSSGSPSRDHRHWIAADALAAITLASRVSLRANAMPPREPAYGNLRVATLTRNSPGVISGSSFSAPHRGKYPRSPRSLDRSRRKSARFACHEDIACIYANFRLRCKCFVKLETG